MNIKDPLSKKRLEKFLNILKLMSKNGSNGKKEIIGLDAAIDPDQLADNIIMKHIAKEKIGAEFKAYYAGKISLSKHIVGYYTLRDWLKPLSEFEGDDLGDVILMDSSLKNDFRFGDKKYNPRIVMDHHNGDIEQTKNNWVWMDRVGASATMAAELMIALKIKMDTKDEKEREEIEQMATMGAIGIANDTHNFTEKITTERDEKMWTFFRKYCNREDYSKLSKLELPERYFELLHQITDEENNQVVFKKTNLVGNTGLIVEDEVDFLALYADLFIQRKDITMVIVWGPVKNLGFVVKMRSTDMNEVLADRIVEIFGSGGAKSKWAIGAGGTFINTNPMLVPSKKAEEADIECFKQHLEERLESVFDISKPQE